MRPTSAREKGISTTVLGTNGTVLKLSKGRPGGRRGVARAFAPGASGDRCA